MKRSQPIHLDAVRAVFRRISLRTLSWTFKQVSMRPAGMRPSSWPAYSWMHFSVISGPFRSPQDAAPATDSKEPSTYLTSGSLWRG